MKELRNGQDRPALQDWIGERRGWPAASAARVLFLNHRGGRLSARAAGSVFTANRRERRP